MFTSPLFYTLLTINVLFLLVAVAMWINDVELERLFIVRDEKHTIRIKMHGVLLGLVVIPDFVIIALVTAVGWIVFKFMNLTVHTIEDSKRP